MSRNMLCALAALVGLVVSQAAAVDQEKPKFVGAEACGMCHKSAAKGDQLGIWQKSDHAKAYATLATPKAKEIATAKGIADPQKADACLKCHVTAHGVDASLLATTAPAGKYKVQDGVGCESCHGAGSQYKSMATMKVKASAIAAGLVMPDEKLCKKCHNAESPTAKAFVFADMVKKIAHKYPPPPPAAGAK